MITPDRIRDVLADLDEAIADDRVDPGYALEEAKDVLTTLARLETVNFSISNIFFTALVEESDVGMLHKERRWIGDERQHICISFDEDVLKRLADRAR